MRWCLEVEPGAAAVGAARGGAARLQHVEEQLTPLLGAGQREDRSGTRAGVGRGWVGQLELGQGWGQWRTLERNSVKSAALSSLNGARGTQYVPSCS